MEPMVKIVSKTVVVTVLMTLRVTNRLVTVTVDVTRDIETVTVAKVNLKKMWAKNKIELTM